MPGPEDFPKPEVVRSSERLRESEEGVVIEVDTPDRKQAIPDLKLPDRWIIWVRGAKDSSAPEYLRERICIGRIEDDGVMLDEMLPRRIRSLLVKEYFSELPDKPVSYVRAYDSTISYNKAVPETLPEQYRVERFSDILAWFMRNRPQILADSCALLREKLPER